MTEPFICFNLCFIKAAIKRITAVSSSIFLIRCLCSTAAMFMEHWKRRQMRLNYEWDLTGFEDEEVSIDEKAGKKVEKLFHSGYKKRP